MRTGKSNKFIKDLLIKSLLGDLTEKEYNKLLNVPEVKAMMFQQWEENDDIKIKTVIPDYKKILDKITVTDRNGLGNGKIVEIQRYKEKYRNLRKSYLLLLRVASILLIALFAITGLYITSSTKKISYSKVIAPRGQKSKVVFEDGTIAWLNSGSTLSHTSHYNKKNREVELKGEAYFVVAKNKRLPFIVKTSSLSVKSLGTDFDLMAYPEDENLTITLVKGIVQIHAPNNKIIKLSPNQKATYNKFSNNYYIEKVDPLFSISWKDNVLKFDNEPLPNILTHLERWYDVKFYYPENVLGNERFTMTIKTESLREVLNLIRITTPMKFKIEVDSVYITLIN